MQSAFRDIVSDELQKIKPAHVTDSRKNSVFKNDDLLWEYDGLHEDNSIEIESEAILIEMERLLYEELREEMIRRGKSCSLFFSGLISLFECNKFALL